ncbi:MAG: Peptidase inhibitor family [Pseudomonadota bacterium]|jgi:hypothetical protein
MLPPRYALLILAAVLALPLGGTAQAQGQARAASEGCAQHQARFPALIGASAEEARHALLALPGIKALRMGGPETPMTRDYRPDRVTVLIEDGKAARIICG